VASVPNGMSAISSARRKPRATQAHVVDDVVDGDRQRAVVPLHHHAERIADEHQVDAVGVQHARETWRRRR
jgi:hypothetical protein